VSDSLQQPTFDFDQHYSSSASCGVDEIELDSRTKRPIYIGVYGHPRYEISEFLIEAYSGPEEYNPFDVDEGSEDGTRPGQKASAQRREQTSDFNEGRNVSTNDCRLNTLKTKPKSFSFKGFVDTVSRRSLLVHTANSTGDPVVTRFEEVP
jgi:hypothetical protein